MTPEHLHLALNHLPLLGAALSLIPILIGLLTRNRMTLLSGLLYLGGGLELAMWGSTLVVLITWVLTLRLPAIPARTSA
ncbi:MAG: hypothetical protein ACO3NW_10155 [Kiritimatiellia bacterium]